MERSLYNGIFQHEVCAHLLTACLRALRLCFGELCDRCDARPDVLRECLRSVAGWTIDTFDSELRGIRAAVPSFDELLRNSFVVFVKAFYERPGGPRLMQVRLTIPPVERFLRTLLVRGAELELMRAGTFFRPEHALVAKDACMDMMRDVLVDLLSEYVVAQEVLPPPAVVDDDVRACDSISNVSTRRRRGHAARRASPARSETNARQRAPPGELAGAAHRGARPRAPRHPSPSVASHSTRSVGSTRSAPRVSPPSAAASPFERAVRAAAATQGAGAAATPGEGAATPGEGAAAVQGEGARAPPRRPPSHAASNARQTHISISHVGSARGAHAAPARQPAPPVPHDAAHGGDGGGSDEDEASGEASGEESDEEEESDAGSDDRVQTARSPSPR